MIGYPTFCVPLSLFQIFLEAESVGIVELSPEPVSVVAESETLSAGAESEAVSVVAESEAVSVVAEPEILSAGAEPEVSVDIAADIAADIAVAFVALVPVSVVVVEVESSGRPRFPAFPNVEHFASSSSSVEVVGEESVHSPTGARTNYGFCSILSSLGLYQNKNLEHCYNRPSPGYNNVNDTTDLPTDATTSRSRKRDLHQSQEQRKHTSRAARSTPAVR